MAEGGQGDDSRRVLIVRPVQDGWVMGDDLVITVDGTETLADVQELVKERKNVAVTRGALWKEGASRQLEDKFLDWDLNRMGLYDKSVVELHPLTPNSWLWHPLPWYEAATIAKVLEHCAKRKGGRAPLAELEQLVTLPPPLRTETLRTVLRKYPEKVLLELDTQTGALSASANVAGHVPLSY